MPIQNDAKSWKMTETLANRYSSESTQRELSNEYKHERIKMIIKNPCVPMINWTKVALGLFVSCIKQS